MNGPRRLLAALLVAVTGAATSSVLGAPSQAHGSRGDRDPAVVERWSAIATRTVVAENSVRPPVSALYTAFASLAVHDAVVAIEGGFEPYADRPRARRGSSSEAAAATAAYEVLRHYFPSSADALKKDYDAELAGVDEGLAGGVRVGRAAAATLVELRADDGRGDTTVTVPTGDGPGEWVATTPGVGMYAPWLGHVDPLVIGDVDRFELAGPPALRSRQYARELEEVRTYGAKDGSARTPAQTGTAMFWTVNPIAQLQRATGDLAARRELDIAETARAFAILDSSVADALIVAWREKLEHPFWRPETAIPRADTDGNRRTTADPDWTPLTASPPYPEYPSGHATVVGASTEALAEVFGRRRLVVNVPSFVETTPARRYESLRELDEEAMDARIWQGIHFRTAMEDANELGHEVGDWVADHRFGPTRRH